jgi:hypothetical protein
MVKNFDNKIQLDTRITFGGVAGCRSFGCPMDAWKEVILWDFDITHIFRWVNDNLFVKQRNAKVTMEQVVQCSLEMGVLTNSKKYSEFGNHQNYIGFVWDGVTRTVKLPPGKQEEQLFQIAEFLVPGAKFTAHNAEVLLGRLNHITYLLLQLQCFFRGCINGRWSGQTLPPSGQSPRQSEMT